MGWGGIAWQSPPSGTGDDQRREDERSGGGGEVVGRGVGGGRGDRADGWIKEGDLEWRD